MSPVIPKSSYLTGRFACRLPDFHFSSCSSSICSCPGGTMTSVTAIKAGQGQCLQGPWFGVSGAAWWQGFPRHFTTSLRDYLSSKIEDRCLLDPTFGHKIEMVSVTCMTPCGTRDRKIHPSVLPVFQRWDKNTLAWQILRLTSPANVEMFVTCSCLWSGHPAASMSTRCLSCLLTMNEFELFAEGISFVATAGVSTPEFYFSWLYQNTVLNIFR